MTIDYSAFSQPVTRLDIEAFRKSQPMDPTTRLEKILSNGVYGFIGGTMALLLWMFLFIPRADGGMDLFPVIFLLIVPASYIGTLFESRKRVQKLARLYKFSTANNVRLVNDISDPAYPGMIFDKGHSRSLKEALVFPDGTEIGNYEYTTGSGKERRTHTWSYARVKLTRRLPHMVLDAKKNDLFGRISSLPEGFDSGQTLQLEGDFNNYFTLYAPKEYERDALYVFTPDVMAALIDAGQAYDIEVVDDYVYLYAPGFRQLTNKDHLDLTISIINKVSSEIREQTDYYADERVGNRVMNLVAEPGRRLKSSVSIFAFIVLLIFASLYFVVFVGHFLRGL